MDFNFSGGRVQSKENTLYIYITNNAAQRMSEIKGLSEGSYGIYVTLKKHSLKIM